MFDDLKGRRVLITGASSGIGVALARSFAAEGARLLLHGNVRIETALLLAQELSQQGADARAIQADITIESDVREMIAAGGRKWGGIDVLILNAGGLVTPVSLETFDSPTYRHVMDLNLASILWSMQEALPLMQSGSAIINTASIASRTGGSPGSLLYGAAKAAVLAVTRNAARELAPRGIRVNAVGPGFIDTPFHTATDNAVRERIRASIPLGRLGSPKDCAGAYLFLASNQLSGYITGQMIDVNGGLLTA
ncbi:SDR family NAD(P)-dependent oxidoreductase [Aminobacter sp. J44]|uniref:SDR family NAD(P)-dependent oxidoreductase n=1 Tax=Aminobacter sp. J44 TaxID=935262 RepID=UPI00119AA06E|nr:SDR family NAD(P)-dependent oxidoreductase [Aminobacter sp. J44]TWG49534.1 3-oxoacyl-[acyl-carrier protein] reductase [Aminobacter sp. J44]